jgi:hypothetical protein
MILEIDAESAKAVQETAEFGGKALDVVWGWPCLATASPAC